MRVNKPELIVGDEDKGSLKLNIIAFERHLEDIAGIGSHMRDNAAYGYMRLFQTIPERGEQKLLLDWDRTIEPLQVNPDLAEFKTALKKHFKVLLEQHPHWLDENAPKSNGTRKTPAEMVLSKQLQEVVDALGLRPQPALRVHTEATSVDITVSTAGVMTVSVEGKKIGEQYIGRNDVAVTLNGQPLNPPGKWAAANPPGPRGPTEPGPYRRA